MGEAAKQFPLERYVRGSIATKDIAFINSRLIRGRVATANVKVTGAARLYRAASGGPQGYASDTYMPLLPFRKTGFNGKLLKSSLRSRKPVNVCLALLVA